MHNGPFFSRWLVSVIPADPAFKSKHRFDITIRHKNNRRNFPSITAICRYHNILQRDTVPRLIDQFGRKRCQKKRTDADYKGGGNLWFCL